MTQPYFYLAGPMRGYPEFNFPAFKETASAFRSRGYRIISPAERDLDVGFDPAKSLESQPAFSVEKALEADFRLILADECVGVILMDGWTESSGARAEAMLAAMTGRKVYGVLPGMIAMVTELDRRMVIEFTQGFPSTTPGKAPSAQAEMAKEVT